MFAKWNYRGRARLIEILGIYQAGRTHVDCVPGPPLHLLFNVSEGLDAGAIDNGPKRRGKGMGRQEKGYVKGTTNTRTPTSSQTRLP